MEFKKAVELLGDKGISFQIDSKTSCVQFYTFIDDVNVKLGVLDKHGYYLSDFCIDDQDQVIDIIEEFADKEFLVPLNSLKNASPFSEECEMCDTYLNEVEELEIEIGRLREEIEYRDDYRSRYSDLKYQLKDCF